MVLTSHLATDSCGNPCHISMSDYKKAARDQTVYQLDILASSAESLKKQGDESAKKRGKSFEPKELSTPQP